MRYCDWCEVNPATVIPTPATTQGVVGLSAGSRLCESCSTRLEQLAWAGR